MPIKVILIVMMRVGTTNDANAFAFPQLDEKTCVAHAHWWEGEAKRKKAQAVIACVPAMDAPGTHSYIVKVTQL